MQKNWKKNKVNVLNQKGKRERTANRKEATLRCRKWQKKPEKKCKVY